MGYGILITSDDTALRAALADPPSARTAVAGLVSLLGSDTYPGGDVDARSCGPWTRACSLHASTLALCTVDGAELRLVGLGQDPGTDSPWAWCGAPDGPQMRALASALSRGRAPSAAAALAAGVPADVVALGPDRTGLSTRSVWVAHADRLPLRPEADTADRLRALLTSRAAELSGRDSLCGGTVHRVGSVVGPLPDGHAIHLVWSGNRLCRPDQLNTREATTLARSGYLP